MSTTMLKDGQPDYEPGVLRVAQSKTQTKAFYNRIAKFYDLLAERSEQSVREIGLQMLAATAGEKVLEIGFGTGHCLAELAKWVGATGKVYGIDISENMLALAHDLVQAEDLADRVELRNGHAEHLPYNAGSMDAVFMSFTLELSALYRALARSNSSTVPEPDRPVGVP